MTAQERRGLSELIRQNLSEAVDWTGLRTIHCFESIAKLNEVDVEGFGEDKQIFTSRLIDGEWKTISVNGDSVPESFDAVIVPMLGFDSQLNRIGYGGGYYDRLLTAQPNALKIGVCYESGKTEQIPIEPHDVPMDIIVTEHAIYR